MSAPQTRNRIAHTRQETAALRHFQSSLFRFSVACPLPPGAGQSETASSHHNFRPGQRNKLVSEPPIAASEEHARLIRSRSALPGCARSGHCCGGRAHRDGRGHGAIELAAHETDRWPPDVQGVGLPNRVGRPILREADPFRSTTASSTTDSRPVQPCTIFPYERSRRQSRWVLGRMRRHHRQARPLSVGPLSVRPLSVRANKHRLARVPRKFAHVRRLSPSALAQRQPPCMTTP